MPAPLTLEDLLSLRDNRDQFRRLKERVEGAMGVVPFVGAGLSMPCGMPGWGSFLKEEGKAAGCEEAIAACISRSEFEEAAELLSNALGALAFRDRIDGRFGKHAGRAPRGAVLHLPRLTRGPVVTTNFDRVVERVFEEAGAPFEERVFGPKPDLFAAALHENERHLLKVHGDYKDRTDRVLTLAEYEAHYGSKSAGGVDLTRPLPKVLEQVFTSRTLLFLGCSLGPDRTLLLLKRVADLHGAPPPHFAIVPAVADGEMPARIRFLSEHHVRPLWYPEGRHEAVETFLQALLGGGVPPTVGTEPHDPAERLADAERRRAGLASAGGDTSEIDREILALRRIVREGQPLRPGEAFESYRLVKRIGHGGFATVWEAMDAQHTHVAIKVLHPHVAEDPQRRARFFRGARIMKSLGGAGVVKILEVGPEDAPRGYFVMELLSTDLYRTVLAGTLSRDEILGHLVRIGRALHTIHENAHRYVHRDIKPQNILLDASGEAWLSDFDLAGAADTTGGTRTGGLGTFVYSAPECQNDAQAADRRADVFSLGMTAIFCFAGKDLPLEVLRSPGKVLAKTSCPVALQLVLQKAAAWNVEDRYQTAGELCDALEAADRASRSVVRTVLWQARHARSFEVEVPMGPFAATRFTLDWRQLRNSALAGGALIVLAGGVGALKDQPFVQRILKRSAPTASVAGETIPVPTSTAAPSPSGDKPAQAVDTGQAGVIRYIVGGEAREEERPVMAWAIGETKTRGASAMIFLGNMAQRLAPADIFSTELAQLTPVPFYPVRGNHDESRLIAARFLGTNQTRVKSVFPDKIVYSVDLPGGVHFVALDNVTQAGFGPEQLTWLRADLDKAHGAATVKHVIVGMHKALAESGVTTHAMDEDVSPALTDSSAARALLENGGVEVVFASHFHGLLEYKIGNIRAFITGGLGASLDPRFAQEAASYHFLQVNVMPGKPLDVAVVRYPAPAPKPKILDDIDQKDPYKQ